MIGVDYIAWRSAFGEVLDPRLYTLRWLDEQVASGAMVFWHAKDAAMLTELRRYPTGALEIHGMVAAGNLETITGDLIPRAEEWAKQAGCVAAVIESREGWAKVMKKHGYAVHQTAVRKEL